VANQLGGAPAEPSWSMEAEAEAAEQSMACPGPPTRSCRAKSSVVSTPWAAALVPRAEAVGFYIYDPKFYCVCGHPIEPGLVRESCQEERFGGSREVAPCNLPGPLVPRNPHRRRRPRPGRTGPSALQPRFTGDSKWFRRGGGGAQPSRGKCAPPAPASPSSVTRYRGGLD